MASTTLTVQRQQRLLNRGKTVTAIQSACHSLSAGQRDSHGQALPYAPERTIALACPDLVTLVLMKTLFVTFSGSPWTTFR